MFDSVGMWEILVLIIAALFILGPERLPDAMSWVGRSVRKVRDFATGARDQMRKEMGPEFDEFRKPIEDLRSLRNFDPKRAVTQHLFDGDQDPFGMNELSDEPKRTNGATGARKITEPLTPGEKPPVDPDAT